LGACAMKYATAMSPAKMNATGRVNKPSTINTPPTSSIMPLMPESDMGATPVEGETGRLKYFDVPCSRNSRPTMIRKMLSTRGDHVARKLSIAGIIISPMNAPRLCRPPTKRRGRDAISGNRSSACYYVAYKPGNGYHSQRFYNFERNAGPGDAQVLDGLPGNPQKNYINVGGTILRFDRAGTVFDLRGRPVGIMVCYHTNNCEQYKRRNA